MLGVKWLVRRLSKKELTPRLDYSAGMDEIQRAISPWLKERGFRRQGRTYNRICPDGLIHVINFQLGAYPLGGHEIKGLQENMWGRFTVNLGIVLPRLYAATHGARQKKFHRESDGGFSTRLGHLMEGKDVWLKIEPPLSRITATIQTALEQFGLPFLDTFPDHRAVMTYFQKHGRLPDLTNARKHVVAAIAAFECQEDETGSAYFARARQEINFEPNENLRRERLAHLEKLEHFVSRK